MKSAMALALGFALAPAVRAQSVIFDGVDVGPTSNSTNSALGFPFGSNPVNVTVTVTGAGALWNTGISLIVGNGGTASLTISAGGIVQAGGGSVGDNGGIGTLTIDGAGSRLTTGQFFIGTGGNTSNGTVSISNGGTFSGDVIVIGKQDGTGTVVVDGAGSLMTSNGATLSIGNDGTGSGDGTLTVSNGGKVSAGNVQLGSGGSGSANVTLNSGGILETGSILKDTGFGRLSIDGGVLRATSSGSNFLQGFSAGDIAIGSGVTVDTQSFNVGIGTAGIFTGSGGLSKQGVGILTIAGGNTWGGNTTISAGELVLDSYSQSSGQTLVIGATNTVIHGNLYVNGTATFNAGANLAIDVAGVNTLANGQTLSHIITAGTLNATTFNLTDNSALFDFQLVRSGNSIDLDVIQLNHNGVHDAALAGGISSAGDAARVLDGLITAAPGGDMGTVITALGQLNTQSDVGRAAAQTLPLMAGGVAQSMLGMLGSFNNVVQERVSGGIGGGNSGGLKGVSTGEQGVDRHVWAKAFGSRADQDDRSGTSGFSANSWGTAIGADSEVSPGALFGVTYAYANSRIDGNTGLSGAAQHANVDSHVLGIYGGTALQNDMQLGFQADLGRSHTGGSRNINFGGLNRSANSSYATYSAHLGTGLSKDIALNASSVFTPDVRVDYTQLRANGYSESGADALNLNVDANTTRAFVLSAGGRVRHALSDRSWLSANLGAGYDTINDRGNLVSVYAGAPGQSFTTTGMAHSPWLINAGVGYTYQENAGLQVLVRYDVDGRSGYLNQTASLKAGWLF